MRLIASFARCFEDARSARYRNRNRPTHFLTFREALIQNYKNRQYFTELHLGDIKSYNANLHDAILKYPNEYIPMVRTVARLHMHVQQHGTLQTQSFSQHSFTHD